jgi:hypothetical protein
VNEINLYGEDKRPEKGKFNPSTMHKQRRRMVEYDSSNIVRHTSGKGACIECKFCRQQKELKEIDRTSQ